MAIIKIVFSFVVWAMPQVVFAGAIQDCPRLILPLPAAVDLETQFGLFKVGAVAHGVFANIDRTDLTTALAVSDTVRNMVEMRAQLMDTSQYVLYETHNVRIVLFAHAFNRSIAEIYSIYAEAVKMNDDIRMIEKVSEFINPIEVTRLHLLTSVSVQEIFAKLRNTKSDYQNSFKTANDYTIVMKTALLTGRSIETEIMPMYLRTFELNLNTKWDYAELVFLAFTKTGGDLDRAIEILKQSKSALVERGENSVFAVVNIAKFHLFSEIPIATLVEAYTSLKERLSKPNDFFFNWQPMELLKAQVAQKLKAGGRSQEAAILATERAIF